MQDKLNPIHVFISAFGVSSFAGLAALLRAGKEVGWVSILSAMLNSGLLGLAITLSWYVKFQDNIYFLIGVCILAGLGGATMVDFVVQALKSGGLSIGNVNVEFKSLKKQETPEEKSESLNGK